MPNNPYFIGLMSGTSLDGIDCVLVKLTGNRINLIASALYPFTSSLRSMLMELQTACAGELHQCAIAANALSDAYANAVLDVCQQANMKPSEIHAIGMHGQTIRHRPDCGYTLQIGNAALLAELTGITVVSDFRSRDMAANGQGAPLVPAFHFNLFASDVHRAIVNIGGIANVTDLPVDGIIRGWDTGPGNVLMDGWIQRHHGKPYDKSGEWALQGTCDRALLIDLLKEDFFALAPPKSTGRDLFHLTWLDKKLGRHSGIAATDVQATLLEFTACSIATSIINEMSGTHSVFICGGGAHNDALMQRLGRLLAPRTIESTASLGLHPDWVEACAFAWLARERLAMRPGNLPAVTGAKGLRVLGAVYAA